MPDEFRIMRMSRSEATDNFERIVDLLYESHRMIFPSMDIDRPSIVERIDRLLVHLEGGSAMLWGGFENRRLEGFLWAFERCFVGERRLHVNEFIVAKSLRGRGRGRLLLDAATAEARRLNLSAVDLLCSVHMHDTLRFYDKAGFAVERYQLIKRLDGE